MGARPARVERARLEGDIDYLSAAGRKGAKVAAANRDTTRMMQERIAEQRAFDEEARRTEANEHVIPLETYD